MDYDNHEVLYKQLLDIYKKYCIVLDSAENNKFDEFKILNKKHFEITELLKESGMTKNIDLLPLIEQVDIALKHTLTKMKSCRDDTCQKILTMVNRKKQIAGYGGKF
ncbi:hypothetical protein GMMP15_1210017 [Candidatus Magnetomoraceae bacterium gMMP-15]